MNQIDRLLKRARKAISPITCKFLCFIGFNTESGNWTADPRIWDGVPGSGYMENMIPADWVMEYGTQEEAMEAVSRLCETLNIDVKDRLIVLIDSVGV